MGRLIYGAAEARLHGWGKPAAMILARRSVLIGLHTVVFGAVRFCRIAETAHTLRHGLCELEIGRDLKVGYHARARCRGDHPGCRVDGKRKCQQYRNEGSDHNIELKQRHG